MPRPLSYFLYNRFSSCLNNVDDAAYHGATVEIGLALGTELYSAVGKSEESVVFAYTDVFAGHDGGAALADDNFARGDFLTVRPLNAEVFRI